MAEIFPSQNEDNKSSTLIDLKQYFSLNDKIDSRGFLDIQILNSSFLKSLKTSKPFDEKSSNDLNEYIDLVNNNHFLFYSFLLIIISEKNLSKPIITVIKSTFLKTEDLSKKITQIFFSFYVKSETELFENYEVPALNKFISVVFKLPDIISNILSRNYINRESFYDNLLTSLVESRVIINTLLDYLLIEKIVLLKLLKNLTRILLDKETRIITEIVICFEKSLYLHEFLLENFKFNCKTSEQYEKLIFLFSQVETKSLGELIQSDKFKSLFNNVPSVCLVLLELSQNNKYFKNIFINMLNSFFSNKKLCLELDRFHFLLLNVCLFKLIDPKENVDFLDRIFSCVILNFENTDPIKKKISLTLCTYLKNILSKNDGIDKDVLGKIDFTQDLITDEKEKIFFDYERINTNYINDKFYFLTGLRNEFRREVLGIKEETRIENKITLDKVEEKSEKTTYKSIKFQKLYGKYERGRISLDKEEIINKNEDIIYKPLNLSEKSGLKINLVQDDEYNDLKPLNRIVFLKDLLLGLRSEDKERFSLSLDSCERLINNEPDDLEMCCDELSEILLKLEDKYETENFEEKINKSLEALTCILPEKMSITLANRFFSEECSLKQKFEIMKVIESAVERISKNKIDIPTVNPLHKLNQNFITPLLNYISEKRLNYLVTLKDFYFLLAKFVIVISKIIKFSRNSPNICKILIETFKIFIALKGSENTVVIDSLNYYCNIALRFLNYNFLEIYPEFLNNFKIMFEWLDKRFNETKNEELKMEILKNINLYCSSISKIN
jgi:hypothetical protein